ncbi:MAG: energy transducer TonB, partial [Gemmobacter sp.]
PEPEPEQTPDDVAAAIDAAVAGLQAADAPPAPGGQGADPPGPPLNDGELAGLRRTVESCWNKSTVSSDGLRSRVVLRAMLAANASVISIELIESDAPSAAASESAFAAASRALRRCLPQAGLPAEKYETWKEIEFEFDYSADRVR